MSEVKTDLSMIRGDSKSINVTLYKDNREIPFKNGDTLYFTVKQSVTTESKMHSAILL